MGQVEEPLGQVGVGPGRRLRDAEAGDQPVLEGGGTVVAPSLAAIEFSGVLDDGGRQGGHLRGRGGDHIHQFLIGALRQHGGRGHRGKTVGAARRCSTIEIHWTAKHGQGDRLCRLGLSDGRGLATGSVSGWGRGGRGRPWCRRWPLAEGSDDTRSMASTGNAASKGMLAISPRAATLRRRPLARASVRWPLKGGSARFSGTMAAVARRTAAASASMPAAGSWRTRTPVNQPVPGPRRHSSGPGVAVAAVAKGLGQGRNVVVVHLAQEAQRDVPAGRADETQALGAAEFELECIEPLTGELVGPDGDEEAHGRGSSRRPRRRDRDGGRGGPAPAGRTRTSRRPAGP